MTKVNQEASVYDRVKSLSLYTIAITGESQYRNTNSSI